MHIQLPQQANPDSLWNLDTCDLSQPEGERQTTLRNIFRKHHERAAPLREPKLLLHDHMPHILGSGFDIGQDSAYLETCYETVLKSLKDVNDSEFVRGEGKIQKGQLWEYFRKKEYSVALVDFFDEEFARAGGNWKTVVEEYLFSGDKPLMNGLLGGLGHPLIHLSYAYAFNCAEVASEGMSLLCTDYPDFHELLDCPTPKDTSTYKTESLAEVFDKIRLDRRLEGFPQYPGIVNMDTLMEKYREVIIEHWNAWEVTNAQQQLEHICDLATLAAMTTYDKRTGEFDFFLIHMMTSAHALRSCWPHWPEMYHKNLAREWALAMVALYVCQQRPFLDATMILSRPKETRSWDQIFAIARDHPAKFDVHFFKCIRAPKAFEDTYGEKHGFYRIAASAYLDTFRGWTGFGKGIPGYDEKKEGWQAPELAAQ